MNRWRKGAARVCGVAAFALLSFVDAAGAQTRAIVGGRLIDGTGAPPMADSVVLIEGDRIAAMGHMGEIEIPEGAEIIDAEGMSVTPGLIDVHVHFDILGHSDYQYWFPAYEGRMRSDVLPTAAAAMLRAGVTSVRDLGSDVDNIFWIREEVNSGRLPGPRTFIAGPFLRKTATSFVSEDYVDTWVVEDPEDGRDKVRRLVELGVDVIKTQDPSLSKAELAAIYDEAHRLGMRVASHIYRAEDIRTALEAGLGPYDTIEHIGDGEDMAYAEDIVRMAVANRVAMAPTIIALEGVRLMHDDPELTDHWKWRRDLPRDIYLDIRRSYRDADLTGHPLYARATRDRPGRMAKLRQLRDAGAIFAISSDSGTRGNPHHDATWREMALVREATGMTNLEVIRAATHVNSVILQYEDDLGALAPGKLADILIVDGNPAERLSDFSRLHMVIKGGAPVVGPGGELLRD
ncbi:MAG: amidohydrolase family protein [Parvularculaceae bacterium]